MFHDGMKIVEKEVRSRMSETSLNFENSLLLPASDLLLPSVTFSHFFHLMPKQPTMLNFSIALFAIAAILGLVVLMALLKKKETPKPVVFAHGAVAAIALVLLIVYGVRNPGNVPMASIIIFALAAIGGFYLFFNDMKKKPGPVSVAVIHALAAVTGFVVLLLFAFA